VQLALQATLVQLVLQEPQVLQVQTRLFQVLLGQLVQLVLLALLVLQVQTRLFQVLLGQLVQQEQLVR
jgi:hypothetical protein